MKWVYRFGPTTITVVSGDNWRIRILHGETEVANRLALLGKTVKATFTAVELDVEVAYEVQAQFWSHTLVATIQRDGVQVVGCS